MSRLAHPVARGLVVVALGAAVVTPPAADALPAATTQHPGLAPQIARALARRADDVAARRRVASAVRARAGDRRMAIRLDPGDLVTATTKRSSTLRLQLGSDPIKIRRHQLETNFVPRAVDYQSEVSLVAIAAVSQVLVLDTVTGAVTVLDAPGELAAAFGFVNDVLFLDAQTLLIADMGSTTSGQLPQDGHLWRYDIATATFSELATKSLLSNPRELGLGPTGEVYLVDGEAGPLITPIFEQRYDRLYLISGKKLLNTRIEYGGPGIQATGFDVGPDGRFWFANLAEIVILDAGVLSYPCGLTLPFRFATGLVVAGAASGYLLDGAGSPSSRALYQVDDQCTTTLVSDRAKLKEARGLVQVPEIS